MAFKLDNDLLEELGLAALSAEEKQAMLRQILETLEMRVGTTLASRMSDAQLDEFERLMPAEGDDQTAVQQKEQHALQWLETNFPNYKQVVNDELERLKSEIKESAPQIVAASQHAGLPGPAQQQPDSFQAPAPMAPPADFTQPAQPQFDQAPAAMPSSMPASQPAAPYQPQEPSMSVMPPASTTPTNDYTIPAAPANPYQSADPYQQPSVLPTQDQPFNPPSSPYAPPAAPTDNPSPYPPQQPPFSQQ